MPIVGVCSYTYVDVHVVVHIHCTCLLNFPYTEVYLESLIAVYIALSHSCLAGQTPVHLVAKSSHTQVLRQLVNAKADIDVQDSRSGKTALHHAVENGDLPMTGYLVTEVCMCVCTTSH